MLMFDVFSYFFKNGKSLFTDGNNKPFQYENTAKVSFNVGSKIHRLISVKHVFFQFDGDACYFSLKYTTSLWKLTFTADFRAPLKAITVKCCCVGTEKGREDLLKVNKAHDEMYCRWRGKVG